MKKFALLLASVMMLSLLAACSNGSSSTTPPAGGTSEGASETAAPATEDRKEVVMWGSWSGDQVGELNQLLDLYNASQDEVTVRYVVQDSLEDKLLTAIVAGELPDLIMWDRYLTTIYASRGALASLDDKISADAVDMNDFYAPAVDEMTVNGSVYGVPLLVDARILFYNKAMLEKADIDPDSIKTWDDLAEAAIALTVRDDSGKLVQSGFSLSDPGLFNIYITQAGGKLVDDSTDPATTAYNSPEGLAVLDFWNRLLNEEKVYELGYDDSYGGNAFNAEALAIKYDGPWALAGLETSGIEYGVLQPPMGPSGDKGAIMGGYGLVIPNGAANEDEAWDFIKWWTTQPENGVAFAQISGWLPASISAADDAYFTENEVYSVFVETMKYAVTRPIVPGYADVEGLALRPQLDMFVSGEVDAETALSTAGTQGDALLVDAAD